jgi:hypothetical protein
MPEGIWGALGAALSQGSRTLGVLNAEEKEQKLREEALRREQERYEASQRFQQEQFAASQKERELSRLRQSILDAPEGSKFDPAFVEQAKAQGFGHLFETKKDITGVGPGMLSVGIPNFTTEDSTTRRLSVQEKAAQAQAAAAEKARADAQAYRDFIAGNPTASAQDRFSAATKFGQKFEGLSPDEVARMEKERDAREFAQARSLAGIRAGGSVPDFTSLVRSSVDDVRARVGQQSTAVSQQIRMLSESGQPVPQELLDMQNRLSKLTEQDILKTAVEQARGILNAQKVAPQDAPQDTSAGNATQDVISNIDEDVKQFGGNFAQLKQWVLANQGELRKQGIDVPAYLGAVRQRIPHQNPLVGDAARAASQPVNPFGFLKQTERFSK